jgi:hypothetical protein
MKIMFAVSRGERPDTSLLPPSVSKTMVVECWSARPEDRPNMTRVLHTLSPAAMHAEEELIEEQALCVVCLTAKRTHVLIPCGHLCVCLDCS